MSGWQRYYEHIDGMTDEEMLAEDRRSELAAEIEQLRRKIEGKLSWINHQLVGWRQAVEVETLRLTRLAQAAPEGQLSYLRIAWQEWDTGIRTGPTALRLADLLAGQRQDQKLAPVHQPVPSQNRRRA